MKLKKYSKTSDRCWTTGVQTVKFFAYNKDALRILVLLLELFQAHSSAAQRSRVISSLSIHHGRHHQSPNVFSFDFRKMEATFAQDVGKKGQEVITTKMSNIIRFTLRVDCIIENHCHSGQQEIQFLKWQLSFLKFCKQH